MDQTVPYRRITGANKEPLGCGRGPASESLAKANESDQPRAGDREADMFLQTFQYQPRDNTTHLPAQTMHATRDEKPPSFDRLMSLPSASRYLPPAPMVDQPETEALSGNGVDFPKCFHCGRWKIDVCHAAHSTECRAACMYCKNAQHNGRPCPRLWCTPNWWNRHYGAIPADHETQLRPDHRQATSLIASGNVWFERFWKPLESITASGIKREITKTVLKENARAERIKRQLLQKQQKNHDSHIRLGQLMAEVAKEQAGRRNAEAAKAALALELELEQMKAQNRLVEEENRVLKEENRALQEQMTRMEEEHRLMWEAIKRIEEEGESRGAVGTEPETRVADEPKPDTCEAYESIPQPKVETCAGDI